MVWIFNTLSACPCKAPQLSLVCCCPPPPPKSHREPVLRPVPPASEPASEPASCIVHPAATRPSRDNITDRDRDRAPARLASFGASSSSCPESHARLRAVGQHSPRLSLLSACGWQLPLGAATKAIGPPEFASVLCSSGCPLHAAPQEDCSGPSLFSEPAPSRSIYRQQVRRRPALRGVWLGSRSLFRPVLCVCVKLLAPPNLRRAALHCAALHRIHCFLYYTILYYTALPCSAFHST